MGEIIYKLAETPEEKDLVFQLRFQGYCLEREYLNPANYPDQREKDECDNYAYHFLAMEAGRAIGTLRLIQPFEKQFYSQKLFEFNFPSKIPKELCLEVSRLYVVPHRKGWKGIETMFGLVKNAKETTINNGYKHWYFLMETTVEKILAFYKWKLIFLSNNKKLIKLADDAPASLLVRPAVVEINDENMRFPIFHK